jgi:hypothetical protein
LDEHLSWSPSLDGNLSPAEPRFRRVIVIDGRVMLKHLLGGTNVAGGFVNLKEVYQ